MPEGPIEQLPHGLTPNSFRIFAEWLRDNRAALEKRLDSQDTRIGENQASVMRKLEEVHAETRRTNGRVTALERRSDLADALNDGRDEWEAGLQKGHDRREHKLEVILGATGIVIGAIGGNVGHFLGWW